MLEAVAGLIAVGCGLVYLKDPAAGRALFQAAPWLILTVAVLGGGALLVYALVSRLSVQGAGTTEELADNVADRAGGSSVEVERRTFPKVEADRAQERILSLEEKLDRLDWFQFEKVVALLYSARGCRVERRGGAKPDGGIDLVIESGPNRVGLQCKYWKAYEVGVREVRELMGALQDARIPKGVIVSVKGFTAPARELAERNGIELLARSALIKMLNEARFTPHIRELKAVMESDEKYCPRCERLMVLRRSSRDGGKFWGCSSYPRCRYTMNIAAR